MPLIETWKAMEQLQDEGLVKRIGVSNFNEKQIVQILNQSQVKPFANQIECHVKFQNKNLIDFCLTNNIQPIAFAPLGSPGRNQCKTNDYIEKQSSILTLNPCTDSKVTNAQIMLAFLLEQQISVVVGAIDCKQIEENFKSIEIRLSETQMEELRKLDSGERTFFFDRVDG